MKCKLNNLLLVHGPPPSPQSRIFEVRQHICSIKPPDTNSIVHKSSNDILSICKAQKSDDKGEEEEEEFGKYVEYFVLLL